ncbi:MAG: hypothetical protein DRI39_02330 [Chloroflexi bacterium]|nr:MAG: hypothetical protein DRI39_02330 [Chloroflexota bacterium]RLC95175.1 MAG: hypothetical protein DRI40_06435 [Chloroflexota bacterium]
MGRKLTSTSQEAAVASECCHHWIIEGGTSLTSKGVCKFCGMQKQFKNTYKSKSSGDSAEKGTRRRARRKKESSEDVMLRIERLFALVGGVSPSQSDNHL